MKKQPDKGKITALYERLSHDDERAGESVSIENQKRILEDYAQKNGFTNIRHFTDDGVRGTTFKRPGLDAMLEEIRAGNVATVIIKDQSRIGRDVVEVGLLKRTFDEYHVRFIAANDNLDTANGFDIMSIFRDVINEWYVADTSRKSRPFSSREWKRACAAPAASAKIGYRVSIVLAHAFAALGLLGLGLLPYWLPDPYWGLLAAIVLYAIGGGLLEVLVSPIVEACPFPNKAGVMSTLHSFYCWGCVFVILASTAFFALAGTEHWRYLAMLWALLPLINGIRFLHVPIAPLVSEEERMPLGELLRSRVVWLFFLLMICAGASEQAMSQWASAFAESGLQVSKAVGDLAGPCPVSFSC